MNTTNRIVAAAQIGFIMLCLTAAVMPARLDGDCRLQVVETVTGQIIFSCRKVQCTDLSDCSMDRIPVEGEPAGTYDYVCRCGDYSPYLPCQGEGHRWWNAPADEWNMYWDCYKNTCGEDCNILVPPPPSTAQDVCECPD